MTIQLTSSGCLLLRTPARVESQGRYLPRRSTAHQPQPSPCSWPEVGPRVGPRATSRRPQAIHHTGPHAQTRRGGTPGDSARYLTPKYLSSLDSTSTLNLCPSHFSPRSPSRLRERGQTPPARHTPWHGTCHTASLSRPVPGKRLPSRPPRPRATRALPQMRLRNDN
jgi:hypothetical protein